MAISPTLRPYYWIGALMGFVCGGTSLGAATFVWDGGHASKNRWTDNNNWDPNGAPPNDGTADLIFAGTVRLAPDTNGSWSINSITFNNTAGAFTLEGDSVTINGTSVTYAIRNDDDQTQTINHALITGADQSWAALSAGLAIGGSITNNFALSIAGSSNTSISGSIGGTGSLIKTDTGTLTLTGANTYSGGTSINAGTLQGDASSLQGNITNNAASLVFDQASSGGYSGVISGSGALTKSGAGNLTLSGANLYDGTTTVASGILTLSGGSAIKDTSAVALTNTSGAALALNNSETIGTLSGGGASGGNVSLGANTLTVSSGNYAGAISGSGGSLVKDTAATLILTGANTYSGGTSINAGTLQGDAASLQGNITNNASLVFDQASSGGYSGVISGSGDVTKLGVGNLTLSGANDIHGTVAVTAGTLSLGANDSVGADATLDIQTGGSFSLGGSFSTRVNTLSFGNATLDFGTAGTANAFLFDNAGTASGTLSITNWESGTDTLAFAAGSTPISAYLESFYFSGIGAGTLGATDVSVAGYAGTWDTIIANIPVFTVWNGGGANDNFNNNANWDGGSAPGSGDTTSIALDGSTRTGPKLNSDFTLNRLKFNSTADAFTITANSGREFTFDGIVPSIIQASSANQEINAPIILVKNTFVEISGAGDLALSGELSGAGGLTTLGTGGELILSGANTYTGSTSITESTVILKNSTGLGSTSAGTSVSAAATVRLENNINVGAESLALSGSLVQSSGSNAYAGAISGTGTVNVNGGSLTLNGGTANTYTGATTVNAGTLALAKSSGNAIVGEVIIGPGTLRLDAANQIADSSRVTLSDNSAVFNLNNNSETVGSIASAYSGASVTLGSATLTTGGDNSSSTFAGAISGSGGITKTGSGTFTLSGNNTYSGATTVSNGTLLLGASNRIDNSSALNLAGGTISLGGTFSETVGVLSYENGEIDFGTTGTGNNLLFANDGASTGALVLRNWTVNSDVFGSASSDLDQAFLDNIFFDGIGVGIGAEIYGIINIGGTDYNEIRPIQTFVWNGGNSSGPSPRNAWSRNANWDGGLAPGVGDGKAIVMAGSIDLTNDMNAAYNIHSLLFNSSAGAFNISSSTDDTLTVKGGGIYNDSTATQTLGMDIALGGNQTWNAASGDLNIAGANVLMSSYNLAVSGAHNVNISPIVSGSGNLSKAGDGTLALSGANTYTGTTTVNAGTLEISNASALGSSAAGTTIASGATLALSGGITVASEALTLNGTLQNLSGANGYGGEITFGADASVLADAGALSLTGTLAAGGALTVGGAGNVVIDGTISGLGDFTKTGAGSVTFNADQTIDTLTLAGGTLALGDFVNITVESLSITADSIIDFGSERSIITINGNITFVDEGTTLTINNWNEWQDYIYALDGTSLEPGSAPLSQIQFAGWTSPTKYASFNSEITPVPEPRATGALLLGGLIGILLTGRRRVRHRARAQRSD